MARIVLDTDVVSQARAGRLAPHVSRQLIGHEPCVAFATAGEPWKGALAARWGGIRQGGLQLWLDQATILRADLKVAYVWGEITVRAQRRGTSTIGERHLDRRLLYRERTAAVDPQPAALRRLRRT